MADELPLAQSTSRFVGKTIAEVDATCVNNVVFTFTDGSKLALHIECDAIGLPEVQSCTSCA